MVCPLRQLATVIGAAVPDGTWRHCNLSRDGTGFRHAGAFFSQRLVRKRQRSTAELVPIPGTTSHSGRSASIGPKKRIIFYKLQLG